MTLDTCYKYFVFLNNECDRYLEDGIIEDEEIHFLKIEFDLFIEKLENSALPEQLKERISVLEINYKYSNIKEFLETIFKTRLFRNVGKKRNLNTIENFKYQIKSLPMFIKINFD